MPDLSWMKALARGRLGDWSSEPFNCDEWAAVTNGIILLLVRGGWAEARKESLGKVPRDQMAVVIDQLCETKSGADVGINEAIDTALAQYGTVSLEELRQWCGPGLKPCDACRGSGSHECSCGDEHECGVCEGEGEINADNQGVLAGRVVNRGLLSRFLEHLPSSDVRIARGQSETGELVLLWSADWRLAQMAMVGTGTTDPVFSPKEPSHATHA